MEAFHRGRSVQAVIHPVKLARLTVLRGVALGAVVLRVPIQIVLVAKVVMPAVTRPVLAVVTAAPVAVRCRPLTVAAGVRAVQVLKLPAIPAACHTGR